MIKKNTFLEKELELLIQEIKYSGMQPAVALVAKHKNLKCSVLSLLEIKFIELYSKVLNPNTPNQKYVV